jgi:hypothetical protein
MAEEEESLGPKRYLSIPQPAKKPYESDKAFLDLKQARDQLHSNSTIAKTKVEDKDKDIKLAFNAYLEECKKPNIGVWDNAHDKLKRLAEQIGTIQSLIQKMRDNEYPGAAPYPLQTVSEYKEFQKTPEYIAEFQNNIQAFETKISNLKKQTMDIAKETDAINKLYPPPEIEYDDEEEVRSIKYPVRSPEHEKKLRDLNARHAEVYNEEIEAIHNLSRHKRNIENDQYKSFIKYLRTQISVLEEQRTSFQAMIRNIKDKCYENFEKEDTYRKLKEELDSLKKLETSASNEYIQKFNELEEYKSKYERKGGNSRRNINNTRRRSSNTRRNNTHTF